MTNADGSVVEEDLDYYPYGGIVAGSLDNVPQNYKFNGKERDAESGLDNFGARYNASTLGRFMTPDWAARPTTVPYAVFGDPQSLNLYGYVRNDPVSRADADGDSAAGNAGCGQQGGLPCGGDTSTPLVPSNDQNQAQTAQNQIAQLEEPEREKERPEEREERALEPLEATTPAGTSPAPVDPVLARHSESDIQAVRNGADFVIPSWHQRFGRRTYSTALRPAG